MSSTFRRRTASLVSTGALVAGTVMISVTAPAVAEPAPVAPATQQMVTADVLPTAQIDGVAWSQVIIGNNVYVGGSFANARPAGAAPGANTVPRANLMAYNLTTGALNTTFAPALNAQARTVAKSPDGTRLYVGGDFTTANGQPRGRIAAYDTATGALIATFTPNFSGRVMAIVATDTTVYVGGDFTKVNGSWRIRVAALRASDGALLGWNPQADRAIWSMTLTPDGSKLIVGGGFEYLNTSVYAPGIGALDPVTPTAIPWGTTVRAFGPTAAITSVRTDGTAIYASAYSFGALPGEPVHEFEGVASLDPATGAVNWLQDCHGDSYDVAPIQGVVYSVSHAHYCSTVGGFPQSDPWSLYMRKAIAFTKATTGTLRANEWGGYKNWEGTPSPSMYNWFPDLTNGTITGQSQAAWTATGNSEYLLLGGEFPSINGTAQQGLARFAIRPIAPAKQGPRLAGSAWVPTAIGLSGGRARVSWPSNWDRDDLNLTYTVTRGSTVVQTKTSASTFWNLPTLGFIDTGLTPGSSYSYRVTATDHDGNLQNSQIVSVTVPTGGAASSAYADAVIADAPSLFYRLDETSGPAVYDHVGFNDGTAGSGVTRGKTGAIIGDVDAASAFNGTDPDGMIATQSAMPGPDTFTIEAWFKTTSTMGGKIIGFGDNRAGNSSSYDRHVYLDNDGHVWFGVYPGGVRTVTSADSYNDGAWHQVVASLGSSGMQLYVDGRKVGQRSDTTSGQAFSGYWKIGGDNLGGWPKQPSSAYVDGAIDEVAVYPTVLSKQQIVNHFTKSGRTLAGATAPSDAYGKAVYDADPLLYWRLGEASGDTATDSGPNQSPGTLTGGTTRGTPGALVGLPDSAITLNGTDGGVFSQHSFTNPTVYSQELWFSTTTDRGGKLIGFGGNQTGASGNYDRHVWMQNDGTLVFGTWTGQMNTITSPAAYNDGTWHHVVATQSSGGMKLYVDGVLVGSNPQPDAQAYTGFWRVGGDVTWFGADSWYFAGSIDEVAVYGDELPAATVLSHYQLGSGNTPNQAPTAAFTSSIDDLKVAVDGSASSDPDGTVASYSWDFGDGSAAGSGATASHSYAAAGTYQVTLTVTDNRGGTDSVSHTVTAIAPNQAPVAAFTSTVSDLTAAFDGSTSSDPDGTVVSYSWNFGDGSAAGTGATASHTYATPGTYTVKLTVTDNRGGVKTVSHDVTVTAPPNTPPVARFTSAVNGLTVSVDGSTSSDPDGTVASYSWNFGDGSPAKSGKTPTHAYAAAGTYTVTLTVTDDRGGTDAVSHDVVAVAGPVVIAADAFARTLTNSWGAADTGGVYTPASSSTFSVGAGTGKIRVAAGSGPTAWLNALSARNMEGRWEFATDKAATGSGLYLNVMARKNATGDYRVKVRLVADGSVQLVLTRVIGSTETTLGSTTIPALSYTPGASLSLAYQVKSSSPTVTTVAAKVWKTSGTEPSSYQLQRNDSTAGLQTDGYVGVQAYASGSATNGPIVFAIDNLHIVDLGN